MYVNNSIMADIVVQGKLYRTTINDIKADFQLFTSCDIFVTYNLFVSSPDHLYYDMFTIS